MNSVLTALSVLINVLTSFLNIYQSEICDNVKHKKVIDKIIAAKSACIPLEAVWNMDSDSCHSSVVKVIYNLRKKIRARQQEPDLYKNRIRCLL